MRIIKYTLYVISVLATGAQGAEMNPKTLLPKWDFLKPEQQELLWSQLEEIDLQELERQRAIILQEETSLDALSVFEQYQENGNPEDLENGKKIVHDGKVGCLIVAGGQGSRLSYTKPKGLYPVTVVQNKCLFQLFAEKILAAGAQVGRPLYVAIMTSPENHEETTLCFRENSYFGLSQDQLFFFSQTDLPLLDKKGNLFLESEDRISRGPDGNASSLKQFVSSGIWDIWHKKGISYLNYMHIDNPLADPFDAELSGFHSRNPSSDVIVKCVSRQNPQEKLGVLFEQKGKVVVVEYSEISTDAREERKKDGSLKNNCANIGLYSFRMDFIQEVATAHYDKLPFHKAWKSVKYLLEDGTSRKSEQPIAWKFEKFIFDVLPFALNVKALLYPREECFAPLKNAEGDDSLFFVQAALQKRDRAIFEKISGTQPPKTRFELNPAFYYPTPELLKKWQGQSLPETPYVLP